MAEYSRTTYNYNNRFTINDDSTDTTKYAIADLPNITDTLTVATEELKPEEAGIIDYGSKFGKGQWTVPLTLYADSDSDMAQLIRNLKEAFNPDLLELDSTYGENTKYNGYHPLEWTETVGGTSYDFRIYAKASDIPQIPIDSLSGLIRTANVKLKIADPRKYVQTSSSLIGAGTATNNGTYTTFPVITVTATGVSSTSLEITNSTTGETLYVTTALGNGDVLTLDASQRSVTLNGVEKRSMLSGDSEWFLLRPGANTISISNDTNVSISTVWYDAFPL